MKRRTSRRNFLKVSGLAGAGVLMHGFHILADSKSPSEKLHIAVIGAGGKGYVDLQGVKGETIVALCDVDEQRAAKAFREHPRTNKYGDYRKLLEKEKRVDAVVVSTPDHHHAPASIMAMNLGKHVYCQKPLTHSVHEARQMRQVASRTKLATQMGNQGHSEPGSRRMVELIRSGAIGDVREVHVWTDRPIWPQGIERPGKTLRIPAHITWDLWLGPAPERPYHDAYAPFKWRGWWDFGTGALGDMACHNMDTAFWALKLGYPSTVEAGSSEVFAETAPTWSVIRYQFPARGNLPPVKLTWYDGHKKPPAELFEGEEIKSNGSLLVGEKGKLYMPHYWGDGKLLPRARFEDYEAPVPWIPRSPGHYKEWIRACKGGPAAMSNFEYAAVLTETVLLGNVALRSGRKINWDAESMTAVGCPEAEQYLRREYRHGYSL